MTKMGNLVFLSSCRHKIKKHFRNKPYIEHCPGPVYPPLRLTTTNTTNNNGTNNGTTNQGRQQNTAHDEQSYIAMHEAMQLQIMNLTTMPVPSQAASMTHPTPPPQVTQNKTFGMAKWRASQKARRQLATIEADCNRKPYHFDEETWRSDDHSYTSYADSATTISNTAMEPSLTDETVDEVGTDDMAPPIVDTITPAQNRLLARSVSTPVRRVRNFQVYEA